MSMQHSSAGIRDHLYLYRSCMLITPWMILIGMKVKGKNYRCRLEMVFGGVGVELDIYAV